ACGFEALEDPKHFLVEFRRDAAAIVLDVKHLSAERARRRRLEGFSADLNPFVGLVVVFDRIGDEISKEFTDARGVAYDGRKRLRQDDTRAIFGHEVIKRAFNVAYRDVEVDRVHREVLAA